MSVRGGGGGGGYMYFLREQFLCLKKENYGDSIIY